MIGESIIVVICGCLQVVSALGDLGTRTGSTLRNGVLEDGHIKNYNISAQQFDGSHDEPENKALSSIPLLLAKGVETAITIVPTTQLRGDHEMCFPISNDDVLTTQHTQSLTTPSCWSSPWRASLQPIQHILTYIFLAITKSHPLVIITSSLYLYFAGSFFFDIAHYLLHKFSKSKYRVLRQIGYLHEVHHLYFNRKLKFNNRYRWQNMCLELPLELFCQLFGTWLGYLIADAFHLTGQGQLTRELFSLLIVFEVLRVVVVALLEGRDSNHKSYDTVVPKDPNSFLVGPEYHAMHHVDPSSYISSSFRIFDWILGTSSSLRSRRIAMTDTSGAFGKALKVELHKELPSCIQDLKFGADWMLEEYSAAVRVLQNTDILIIAHKSQGGDAMNPNCDSAIQIIELFKKHYKPRPGHNLLLPEVWYAADDQRSFSPHARKYHDDESLLYRHILISTPSSKMGWLVLGPEWAARVAMWWIRRGARYVPALFPGMEIWGYSKFTYRVRKVM